MPRQPASGFIPSSRSSSSAPGVAIAGEWRSAARRHSPSGDLRARSGSPICRPMSRRKKSHQSHGTANRPRFWGKHAVAAALDNPDRKVLRAWATREAAGFMNFPEDMAVTLADVADLGRLVPHDAPHQGVVIDAEPLDDRWLADLLAEAGERSILLVLDQVTDPHNVGAVLRSA